MTKVESEIVMDMLGTCEHPPDVDVRETLGYPKAMVPSARDGDGMV